MDSGAPSSRQAKRSDVLTWEEYFMATAILAAERSKDPVTQVGACIVNGDNRIVGVGYNGMPNDCGDLLWGKESPNQLDNKYLYVCHAAMNAILNKNAVDIKGCIIYITLFPCNECAKLIIQSGIKEVVYAFDKYPEKDSTIASKRMLHVTAEPKYRKFETKRTKIEIDFNFH